MRVIKIVTIVAALSFISLYGFFLAEHCFTKRQRIISVAIAEKAFQSTVGKFVNSISLISIRCTNYDGGDWERVAKICIRSGVDFYELNVKISGGNSAEEETKVTELRKALFCVGFL